MLARFKALWLICRSLGLNRRYCERFACLYLVYPAAPYHRVLPAIDSTLVTIILCIIIVHFLLIHSGALQATMIMCTQDPRRQYCTFIHSGILLRFNESFFCFCFFTPTPSPSIVYGITKNIPVYRTFSVSTVIYCYFVYRRRRLESKGAPEVLLQPNRPVMRNSVREILPWIITADCS